MNMRESLRTWSSLFWFHLGKMLSRARTTITCRVNDGAASRILRRRSPAMHAANHLWNAGLLLMGEDVRILHGSAWRAREIDIYSASGQAEVVEEAGALVIPPLRGTPLHEILASRGRTWDRKALSLRLASRALETIHGLKPSLPGGEPAPFSHGDATVRNVMIDEETMAAHWFDFEMIHLTTMPAVKRQADDLRAFAWSAAALVGRPDYEKAASVMVSAYDNEDTWQEVRRSLQEGTMKKGLFHRSQTGLLPGDESAWEQSLLAALEIGAV